MAESNVTDVNPNSSGNEPQIGGSVGDIFAVQEARINTLRQERDALREELQRKPLSLEDALKNIEPPEGYKPTYKINPLKRKDFSGLVAMVRKVANDDELRKYFSPKRNEQGQVVEDSNPAKILDFMLGELQDTFLPWAVGLTDKEWEKWDDEPFSADVDLVNDLKANKDFLSGLKSAVFLVMSGKKLFGR